MYRVWVVASALCLAALCGNAHAQSRPELIAELIGAQGLDEVIAESLEDSKATTQKLGRSALDQMLASAGNIEPGKRKRIEAIFQRFSEQSASLWTSSELVSIFAKHYGTDLSDAELTQMLAYYKSPIGVKDVAAAKIAMRTYTNELNTEGQRRMQAALSGLIADIKKEMGQ
jgi:hypothetical protein